MNGLRSIFRRRGARRVIGFSALAMGLLVVLGLSAPALHLIDKEPVRIIGDRNSEARVAIVLFSGDMGLRFGMSPKIAQALAQHGMPVIGVSSPVNFATHRNRAEVDAIVATAVRTALARTGARRVILMGESFGADIVSAVAPDLPEALRAKVAAITLIVPAQTVFFRADPTGLTYYGTPDAQPTLAMRSLRWTPTICIYGVSESDSLCPVIAGTTIRAIGLPGGHFLRRDDKLLVSTIMAALHGIDPAITG